MVLFRGLRVKVGVDAGPVQALLSSATDRVDYQGRVMKHAALIAANAQAGRVWASASAWEEAMIRDEAGELEARPLPVALQASRGRSAVTQEGAHELVQLSLAQ